MKLLTSPSTSFSSAATSLSFHSDDCSTRWATIRCLASVLRRMLCARSLHTFPADHIAGDPIPHRSPDDGIGCLSLDPADEASSPCPLGPGVVARLMGLESLPAASITRRSKSMDYRAEECVPEEYQLHPSIKTCRSFHLRATPACLEQEEGEFLVLSFEGGSESKELWSTQRKFNKGKKRTDKCRTVETQQAKKLDPRRRSGYVADVSGELDELYIVDITQSRRRRMKYRRKDVKINVEAEECSSEDASPVSVLNFGEWISDPQEANIASDDSMADNSNSNSGWNLSPELPHADHSETVPCGDGELLNKPKSPAAEEKSPGLESWRKDFRPEIWRKICKIADAQTVESNWEYKRNQKQLEELEAMCGDLELRVLDNLLDDLLEELVPDVEHLNL